MTALTTQEVRTVSAIAREGNGMAARAVGHHREAMSAWRLCMIDGCWAYFAQCAPTEVWGDDWNDAPHEHNAGGPYAHRVQDGVLKVAFDGDWEIGGTQHCPLNAPNCPHGYSVQEINRGVMPWLYIPHYGDRYPEPRLAIQAGVTLAEFAEMIEQGYGRVYRALAPASTEAEQEAMTP